MICVLAWCVLAWCVLAWCILAWRVLTWCVLPLSLYSAVRQSQKAIYEGKNRVESNSSVIGISLNDRLKTRAAITRSLIALALIRSVSVSAWTSLPGRFIRSYVNMTLCNNHSLIPEASIRFEIRGSWIRVWKLGSWVLNVQQMDARSTLLKVSSPEFLFNYTQIFLFLKMQHFGKYSHLICLYIIGYNRLIFYGDPTTPVPKSGGRTPRIDAYDSLIWCC